MTNPNLKLIAVSKENYFELKKLGQTADSFNDVITDLLLLKRCSKSESKNKRGVIGDQPIITTACRTTQEIIQPDV